MSRMITLWLCLLSGAVFAHPVSLSWASVVVHNKYIEVNYRILAEDLIYFHHPEHDGFYNYDSKALLSLLPEHAALINNHFYVLDDTGIRLPSEILKINPQLFPTDSIPIMDLMKYSISFKIHIYLSDPDWDNLYFYQEISTSEDGIPAVTLLTIADAEEQKTIEISSGFPFKLSASMNIPPMNPSWLTSSFYTIQPSGTRHELTIPSSVLLDLIQQTTLMPEELSSHVLHYFQGNNQLSGNSTILIPTLSNVLIFENAENLGESMIYLDLYYPSNSPLEQVTINWEDYNWKFRWMNAKIYGWDKEYTHTFSRFQPTYTWQADSLMLKKLWTD